MSQKQTEIIKDQIQETEEIKNQLNASITLCIEAESLFKLYAYRQIEPKHFVEGVLSINNRLQQQLRHKNQ